LASTPEGEWRRIDQEEPFVGRTAEVGDELGSRVVAARLVRDVMRLCFLQERRYAPYSKWLGSAFRELDASSALGDPLLDVLAATDYEAREMGFVEVVQILAGRHNALGITAAVDESVRPFHDRPFRVLGSGRFVDACLERVSELVALPSARRRGGPVHRLDGRSQRARGVPGDGLDLRRVDR